MGFEGQEVERVRVSLERERDLARLSRIGYH